MNERIIENIRKDDFILRNDFLERLLNGKYKLIEKDGLYSRDSVANTCRVRANNLEGATHKHQIRAIAYFNESAERLMKSNETNLKLIEIETNKQIGYWLYVGAESLKVLCCIEIEKF